MCSRVIDDSEKINNSEIVDKKMMIRCSKIAGNFCAARTGRMAKFAAALHVLLALPITVWGAGEYEPVNDFTEGFYLISNANTSTGTWYIYNKQISDAFVFATPNITINNLWYVSKESKPADTQLYTTEGAYEKVTEAAKRIYLCHQGNGSNIRSYQTGTSGSKLEHYRMVILTSDIDGAYVMISNKSATYTPAG